MKTVFQETMMSDNFVYPTDPESRDDVLVIDRKTKEDIRLRHRYILSSDWEANTITAKVTESMIKLLYNQIQKTGITILDDDADNTINFYNLIEIAASCKKNTRAEKIGNINVKFIPGIDANAILSDDTPDEERKIEYISPTEMFEIKEDKVMREAMLFVDRTARMLLKERYGIIIPNDWQSIAIAYTFIENIYRCLVMKLVSSGKNMEMINFNDIIEFNIQKIGENEAKFFLRPGMAAKLIIKNDEVTEADDDLGDI